MFTRLLHNWELEVLITFIDLCSSKARDVEDKLCQWPNKKKLFEVKSYYRALPFWGVKFSPWRLSWGSKFHSRLPFSRGMLLWLRFLQLIIYGIVSYMWLSGVICARRLGKILAISFFPVSVLVSCGPLCSVYSGFSVLCLKESLMCWLMRRGVEGLLLISDVWWAIPLCLLWLIWKEYDRRAFEDVERPLMELKLFFLGLCMSGQLCYPTIPLLFC